MSKKRNKHTYESRLKYMKMLEEGYSINYIHVHYGINDRLLRCLWERYLAEGSGKNGAKPATCDNITKNKRQFKSNR